MGRLSCWCGVRYGSTATVRSFRGAAGTGAVLQPGLAQAGRHLGEPDGRLGILCRATDGRRQHMDERDRAEAGERGLVFGRDLQNTHSSKPCYPPGTASSGGD
ncbi:hypothetical protein GCM10018787_51180 [Streptomyces thermodiastaticus]|nr:hypothetical protein GCM10018787_51180 [Streptomyces thermodiastaticus]